MNMTDLEHSEWHFFRVDEDEGDIKYEAHGPFSSFIVFRGPRAVSDIRKFINAVQPGSSILE